MMVIFIGTVQPVLYMYPVINGGVFGTLLCWIIPILSYKVICKETISKVESWFCNALLVVGFLLIIIVASLLFVS